MTETEQVLPLSAAALAPAVDQAPLAAVVVTAAGSVHAANQAARTVFAHLEAGSTLEEGLPSWLTDAHHGFLDQRGPGGRPQPTGRIGERSFEAHPVRLAGDSVVWWLVEDTDAQLARHALGLERARTAFLTEASSALLSSLNLRRCMEVVAQLAAEHLADAAFVIAPSYRRVFPSVRCLRGEEPAHVELQVDSQEVPGLAEALQGFPPVPSRWIDPAAAPAWLVPGEFGEVGSIVVTPLPGHGVPAGALVLLRAAEHAVFSQDEEVFARLFAARSGAAMSAARMFAEQVSINDTLMRDLLPPVLHQIRGVEFAGRYRASLDSERVGGDFYDVHPGTDEDVESLAVLGDVAGKGLEAAVLTGKIRTTLHALLPMAEDHSRLLGLLNDALLSADSTRFVTLVLASAVRRGPEVHLRVTSAGHPPPLIVRATGEVEEVPTRGPLIGVLPEVVVETAHIALAPGETCLVFTDGVTEAVGGPLGEEMFGEDRLRRVLAECGGMPAEAVVERVHMLAAQWIGRGGHDDMAVLAITAPRGQHLTAVGGQGRGRYTA
ncbi:PP2C family protein-serine/threonine phosphatase [Kutzneria viridogrisea]|uniref:Serine phosphatase RsbU (Regulator of sigma subunit) n=1 Tax=Kutzneria viridogrisea TaxID=47990 RepID=A0ABR6BBD4_9PSEU|nr:serine phosphatase RsbU (regulator of sigma subunit) [Kutzneria viridogrisea]